MRKSLKKAWYGEELTEKDCNNLGDLMLIAIAWIILTGIIL